MNVLWYGILAIIFTVVAVVFMVYTALERHGLTIITTATALYLLTTN